MKRDCEQSHCAECMSPCSSWNKRPFSGREIHSAVPPFSRACRQSGCPHTAAPPTLLLWQIMQGRRAMMPEDPAGLEKGAGKLNSLGERVPCTRNWSCFCTWPLKIKEHARRLLYGPDLLSVYSLYFVICVSHLCVFLLQKLLDQLLQRSNN